MFGAVPVITLSDSVTPARKSNRQTTETPNMSDYIGARERHRNAKATTIATHKFDVGSLVSHRIGASSERSLFRVTRHLPDGGQGLQYRIRSERDGQERVVVEASLQRAMS